MYRNLFIALALTLLICSCGERKKDGKQTKMINIGTGGVSGVYYPTGNNISRMLKKKENVYGIKSTVESTAGSVYNINAVVRGDLDFGITQSDRQYQAYNGLAEWKDKGKQQKLRSVFSLHPESVTLIATTKSGIKGVEDLKGKRVNLGNPGSGHLQNARDVISAVGVDEKSIQAEHIKPVEAPSLLQDERIDAFFYTVGHPNGNIKEATRGRIKVNIIPITGKGIDNMISKKPYYAKSTILKEFYPASENSGDINTVGVKATLVTSADVDDDVVYAVTKEVFENLDDFKTLHNAYKVLTPKSMLEGLSAPIHPGAMKYFKEAGLDKYIKPELRK